MIGTSSDGPLGGPSPLTTYLRYRTSYVEVGSDSIMPNTVRANLILDPSCVKSHEARRLQFARVRLADRSPRRHRARPPEGRGHRSLARVLRRCPRVRGATAA